MSARAPVLEPGCDDRHPGRRPARPHAGAGGRAARLQVPRVRARSGLARRSTWCTASHAPTMTTRRRSTASPPTSTSSPTSSRTFRPRPRRSSPRGCRCCPTRACWRRRRTGCAEKDFVAGARHRAPRPSAGVGIAGELLAPRSTQIGRPAVLKTRRFGYDGKGQATIRNGTDPGGGLARGRRPALRSSKRSCRSSARSRSSPRAARDGARRMLRRHRERAPRPHPQGLARAGRGAGRRSRRRRGASPSASPTAFDYVGVLAVEMFVVRDGRRASWSTRSRRGCTIPATGRSTAPRCRSSSSTSARSPAGRSAKPIRHGRRRDDQPDRQRGRRLPCAG